MPGDIDVWVMAPPKQVIAFARKARPDAFACYHHVEYVSCDGTEVELHYRPAFLNNLIHNRRLQQWFLSEAAAQREHRVELPNGTGTVSVPTNAFNRIFLMTHIMNHVIHDGIGMRQMMDYYYLLRQGFTEEERQHDVQLLQQFGLYDITAAVMFVLRQLFAMPKQYLLVPPDERRGTFLMDEIQYANAVADQAVTCMEAIMQNHPEGIAIICANNDDMAMAAARAAAGNEAYANTVFLGFDGIQSACNSILAGEETMSVCQEGYSMGYNAVDAVVRALQGETLDAFIDAGASVVDPSTAQARLEQLQGYLK
jgi:hypothetical protein